MKRLKPKPFCLPSNYNVLNGYLKSHKKELFNHVVDVLEYVVSKKDLDITIFTFDNSKYSISISPDDIEENVEYLYKMFLKSEQYELCSKINKIKEKYGTTKNLS